MLAARAERGEVSQLQQLEELDLTYPGFERDKREAEKICRGDSKTTLGFDAAIRRLKVKQRAHEDQKSIQEIHRSHPNLAALDSLTLTYPGWEHDVKQAEKSHNSNPKCDFEEILRKIQIKQYRFENDRSHYRLRAIDSLKLSYPGWKADIRSLEKFHFEEAFFLAGDSLFQSKFDGLKRRQQIYLRSQRVRANRLGIAHCEDPEEDSVVVISDLVSKTSFSPKEDPKPENDFHYITKSQSSAIDEERSDRQHNRAPYAVILDADIVPESPRADPSQTSTLEKAAHRPDPPELGQNSLRNDSPVTVRQGVDCDDQSLVQAIDCDEELSVDEEDRKGTAKSDPQGMSSEEQARGALHEASWPSKLSSYIDLPPVREPEESDEAETSEDYDEVGELYSRSSSSRRHRRSKRSIKPKGIYSAPPMPICEEDETSFASRAFSVVSSSSSRAVHASDRSMYAGSNASSTFAVFTGDDSIASGASSRAVWAESPMPYVPDTPFSTRPVVPIETPMREQIRKQQKGGSTSERLRRARRYNEDSSRSRRTSGDERSRASKTSSRASSGSSRSRKLGRCTICGDPDKNHVFVPCGHLCACKVCADQVLARKMTCPVCRGNVTEAIQVFV